MNGTIWPKKKFKITAMISIIILEQQSSYMYAALKSAESINYSSCLGCTVRMLLLKKMQQQPHSN